jgi:hypothetical protein
MILMTDESDYDRHGGLSEIVLEANGGNSWNFVDFPKTAFKGLPSSVQSISLRHEYCVSCVAL